MPVDKRTSLTDSQVVRLRERYASEKRSCGALAREYGISRGGVWYIVTGKSRKDAGGPISQGVGRSRPRTIREQRPVRYPDESVVQAREMVVERGLPEIEAHRVTGMSVTHVSAVVRGLTRMDAGGPILREERVPRGADKAGAILNDEQVTEILRHRGRKDVKQKELAARYHISPGMVGHILHRRKWKHVPLPQGDEGG